MPKLILIKHAAPLVMPGVSSEKWSLSEKGRASCAPLAESIRPLAPARIITSVEPKAAETGLLVASLLGICSETAPGLHEHDRSNVPHLASRDFISLVELFFRRPGERVLGRETADEALDRFESAIEAVLLRDTQQNIAIVSHGTVIALLLARHSDRNGFELWRRMGLPSYAVLDRESMKVESVKE